ncbi:MAG TPA: Mur ligase family protein, partial [Anaerolineaceae bacterium]|nr:Mur ligase family protein [Anaerolineaceae bacterium]
MNDWTGQRILILGAARQGLALARYLAAHGARVTVSDQKSAGQLQAAVQSLAGVEVTWALGGHPFSLLDQADLVCVSGGVPLEQPILVEARRRGLPVTNDSQIFMQTVPCPVIGITGSAGKTTTTTLVGRMAQAGVPAPRKVWIGGNIGQPLISFVDEMKPDDLAVVEFSSFQLELMTVSPQVAAITNITPNHLDRHGTMAAYTAAKQRLLDFQTAGDRAVLGRDDPGAWALAEIVRGELISFGMQKPAAGQVGAYVEDQTVTIQTPNGAVPVMPVELIRLPGAHNILNV